MSIGITQILLVLLAIVILFGLGKLPRAMGDIGKGIREFKAGIRDSKESSDTQASLEASASDDANNNKKAD